MRTLFLTSAALVFSAGLALAQTDQHDGHHPAAGESVQAAPAQAPAPAPAPTSPQAAPGAPAASSPMGGGAMQMMGAMPEQCRRAMQGMPQECMSMMQGGMMMGGMGASQGAGMQAGSLPPHGMEMQIAMSKMDPPMMQAARLQDADESFIRGMIPHHQAAIDMAQTVLKYGSDAQAKKMAADVIRDQTREIADMQDWLKKHGK